jgi:hypothetical protein
MKQVTDARLAIAKAHEEARKADALAKKARCNLDAGVVPSIELPSRSATPMVQPEKPFIYKGKNQGELDSWLYEVTRAFAVNPITFQFIPYRVTWSSQFVY